MQLKHLRRLLVVLVLTIVTFACGPEDVRKFARGMNGTATGIGTGISTVRAFRVAGEIDEQKALDLARAALDVNTVMGETVDFTLKQSAIDESSRQSLHVQLRDISERANRLVQNGTIHLKNEKVKLAFELGTIAGQAALDVAVNDLAVKLPDGKTIPVDDETKRTLEQAREKIKSNDKRLREAIQNLESLIRGAGFGGAGSGGTVEPLVVIDGQGTPTPWDIPSALHTPQGELNFILKQ
jgi:hypothetical protein